jgi:GNAT superfamily N-acetyltransferase
MSHVLDPELVVRPLEPRDGQLLGELFDRLSPQSRYFRFLSPIQRREQARPELLLDLDHRDRDALAALVDGELIAVARYAVLEPGRAEIAVAVADDWHHHGVASLLLEQLAALAAERGITQFTGWALAENTRVLALIRKVFPHVRISFEEGLVRFDIALTADHPELPECVACAGKSNAASALST